MNRAEAKKMVDPQELEAAAATIRPDSLEKAKAAIISRCGEYLARLNLLERALDKGKVRTPPDARKFSRALALFQLAYLPARPQTCPFCIQHSGVARCQGCGYASTHGGRCDAETSAFGQLIESLYELATQIHQIPYEGVTSSDLSAQNEAEVERSRERLLSSIRESRAAAEEMMAELPEASTSRLMEIKARYMDRTLQALPVDQMESEEVEKKLQEVRERVKRYW
jgi:hypothetical protein